MGFLPFVFIGLEQTGVMLPVLLVEIPFAPFVDVDGEHAWVNERPTEGLVFVRLLNLPAEAIGKLLPNRCGNEVYL
jgi:hypothetical protein